MYHIELKKEALLPRERLVDLGADRLSNQELLAILLRTGIKEKPVLEISTQILENISSLADFGQLSLQELQSIKGIGQVKSVEIKAMLELAKRIHKAEYDRKEQMDTQNRIIEQRTIFIGTVRRSVAEPREILHYACKNMATSLIIIHNHPSGSPKPSESDLSFTKKIKRSCDHLGIVCLDHIIVGKNKYFINNELFIAAGS